MSSCVVVGGGIAGLMTAWQLTRRGVQVQVFESADHLGGALAAHRVAGLELNSGAEAFAVASDRVLRLVEALGLQDRVVQPRHRNSWIINVRGAFPSPADSYLGIPSAPLAEDVVRVVGREAAEHAVLDATMPPDAGYRPGLSLGEYVTNRMGRAIRSLLVEPVVGGVHSTHPDLLELDSIAPRLYPAVLAHGSLQEAVRQMRAGMPNPGAAVASLDPVMELLPRALVEQTRAAGGVFHTGVRVQQVVPLESGGYEVVLDSGRVRADQVVLTTPAQATRAMLAALGPVAESIPSVTASPVALVTMVVDDERLDAEPRGNGALVAARTPGIVAKALTHATAKWEHVRRAAEESAPGRHRHVVRLSYGRSGENVPTPTELPDLALNDARRILGVHLRRESIVAVDITRWGQTMTQARPGHQTALQEVIGHLVAHPGLSITGAWMAGTGIAAITAHTEAVAEHLVGDAPRHPSSAEPVANTQESR